tara:strand:- start:86 stop:193 length:108 start_codon:yes stop_codon:yes gene_type:complete
MNTKKNFARQATEYAAMIFRIAMAIILPIDNLSAV